jgi:putative phosphoesterase
VIAPRVVVGVVSDTHLPRFGTALPRALVEGLKAAGVARIVHCGDHTTPLAVALLERIAPVDAVLGNNDGADVQARYGEKKIVTIAGARIGLVHGDRGKARTTPLRALEAFAGEALDVVCFGHSHQPYIERHGDVLLLNPGSPTDRRREAAFSYGLIEIGNGTVSATLQRYAKR